MSESYEESSSWGESPNVVNSNNDKYSNRSNNNEHGSESPSENLSSVQSSQKYAQQSNLSNHVDSLLSENKVLQAKSFFKGVESYLISYSSQHELDSNEQSKMIELFRNVLINNEQYLIENPNNEFLLVSLSLHLRTSPEKQDESYCKNLIEALYEKINVESKINSQLKYW